MWPMTLAPNPCLARANHPRLSVQILEFTGARCKVSLRCVLEIVACANLGPRFVVADVSCEGSYPASRLANVLAYRFQCLFQTPMTVRLNVHIPPPQVRLTPVVGVKCALVVIPFDYVYRNSCRRRCVLLKKTAIG
jgi:hypothetical protein